MSYYLFELCQALGETDVLKFGWTSKCRGVCIASQTSPGFFCDQKKKQAERWTGVGEESFFAICKT